MTDYLTENYADEYSKKISKSKNSQVKFTDLDVDVSVAAFGVSAAVKTGYDETKKNAKKLSEINEI